MRLRWSGTSLELHGVHFNKEQSLGITLHEICKSRTTVFTGCGFVYVVVNSDFAQMAISLCRLAFRKIHRRVSDPHSRSRFY